MVGKRSTGFQARYRIALGWITLAISMQATSEQIDLLMSLGSATLLRIWQYIPVAFLFVPPDASRIRRSFSKRNQRCRWTHEFHARHWPKCWDILRHYADSSAQPESSIRLSAIRSFRPISQRSRGSGDEPDSYRLERAYRSTTGTRPPVRFGPGPSRGSLLGGRVLAAFDVLGAYVSQLVPSEKE